MKYIISLIAFVILSSMINWQVVFIIVSGILLVFILYKEESNKKLKEELNSKITYLKYKEKELEQKEKQKKEEFIRRQKEINDCKQLLNVMNTKVLTQIIDSSPYDNIDSVECKNKLELIRMKEKELVKNNTAIISHYRKDNKITANNKKQLLKCFSLECKNIIDNVNSKTVNTARDKINKSFTTLNKIFETDKIELSLDLLNLKYEELALLYTYKMKKEEEKEQQRYIKEKLLEEEKVRLEIEEAKKKIQKEEHQFKNEIDKLMQYMQKSNDEVQTQLYIDKIKELEEKLRLLEIDRENVLKREQNTRAGFVYIISNIGSFGENVYKIGMTRRLEPMDRIKELSGASVPFPFDVHALIFSEDAPALEKSLHDTFRKFEVNKINHRKEFFNVNIDEIKKIVLQNHNATVNFIDIPPAEEYNQSLKTLIS